MILLLPLIPFVGALAILMSPSNREDSIRRIAIMSSLIPFFITLLFLFKYDYSLSGFQFVKTFEWLPSLGINYQVGFDGINLTFCFLHALVSLAGAFMACRITVRVKEYLFYYLVLIGAIYGVFTILDLFFMYMYYETTLIPLFPMIGIWGSKNKSYGAMKLTLYITLGAMLTLFGLMMFYYKLDLQTFDLITIQAQLSNMSVDEAFQIFLAPFLIVGLGIMASLWPLHSWSPIGYAAAPTAVSMLHAGVLKKMAPYILLRTAIAFLPEGTSYWSGTLAVLAAIGMLYAGFAAIWQKDLKFIVGFSSVSHMGYVLLGLATLNTIGVSGAVLLMFSHGVMAACTFACIGFLYEQTHQRTVLDYGGLAKQTPFIAICFIMACMASLGLPGFSNFASEIIIFIGAWEQYPILVGLGIFCVLVTAIYLLRAIQKVCYGVPNAARTDLVDAQTIVDKLPFILLLGALLLFGIWPNGLLRIIEPSVEVLLS